MENEKIARELVKLAKDLTATPRFVGNESADNNPWDVASEAGINILSGKDFVGGHIVDGKFVSVLFDEADRDGYGFDIAVLPEWQRKGLGSKLLDIAIDEFGSYEDAYGPDYTFNVDAVNKHMIKMLKRKGFTVTDVVSGHTLMSR